MRKKLIRAVAVILSVIMISGSFLTVSFATSGNISGEIIAKTSKIAERIEAEGIVLLKNDNNFLPLKGKKLNIFGVCSAFPYIGGTGSGCTTSDNPVYFYDALDEAGVEYNTELRKLYEANGGSSDLPYVDHTIVNNLINITLLKNTPDEMDPRKLTSKIMKNALAYSDTALIVIGRTGTEGGDLSREMLRLDSKEQAMVEKVCTSFKNVIVMFNTGNVIEMGWMEKYESIKAALEVWIPGEFGFRSVVGVLTGKINPSGRLADTVAYSIDDYPSTECFGSYEFTDAGKDNYVEYQDGIYVGYRYFETMAKDKVQFPFGYGLSYTKFSKKIVSRSANSNKITVSVRVTNTGRVAGKDTVQIYYSAPYKKGGIEKSAICLAAFGKTNLLAPGKSQTLTLSFATRDMASYDYLKREAYVLEKGTYKIILGENVRDCLGSFTYNVGRDVVYKKDAVTGNEIKNLFGFADSGCTYLSRNDPEGTMPEPRKLKTPETVKTADEYPEVTKGEAPKTGVKYEKTIMLSDVKKDSSLWEKFLDQFTLRELILMAAHGGYQTYGVERLGVPQTMDDDGPLSVKGRNGTVFSDSGTAYPCEVCVACTWNTALAKEMGEGAAEEAADMGVDVWYAPAVNIHRSPMGGRNYEYYSEDPLLSGKFAAAVMTGCHENGLVTTIKHFALNDQETHRNGGNIFCNEQAMREIYLRAFEIPIKESKAIGVMSAYNRIGGYWCGGCSPLLKDLLRKEWGFGGFVVSDYSSNLFFGTYMSPVLAVYNGNDVLLNGIWEIEKMSQVPMMYAAYNRDPAGFGKALREAAKNTCTMKMHTKAFNDPGEYPDAGNPINWIVSPFEWKFEVPLVLSGVKYVLTNAVNLFCWLLYLILM